MFIKNIKISFILRISIIAFIFNFYYCQGGRGGEYSPTSSKNNSNTSGTNGGPSIDNLEEDRNRKEEEEKKKEEERKRKEEERNRKEEERKRKEEERKKKEEEKRKKKEEEERKKKEEEERKKKEEEEKKKKEEEEKKKEEKKEIESCDSFKKLTDIFNKKEIRDENWFLLEKFVNDKYKGLSKDITEKEERNLLDNILKHKNVNSKTLLAVLKKLKLKTLAPLNFNFKITQLCSNILKVSFQLDNLDLLNELTKYCKVDFLIKRCIEENKASFVLNLLKNHKDKLNKEKIKPLFLAVGCGKKNMVEIMLNQGYNKYDELDEHKKNILHHAVESGNLEMLKYITSKYPNLNDAKYYNGESNKKLTPLSYTDKNEELLLHILDKYKDIKVSVESSSDNDYKLIAKAVENNFSFKTISFLIDKLEKEKKLNGEIWKGMTTSLASYLTKKESWKALGYLMSKEDLKLDEWYDHNQKWKLIAKMIDQEASFEKIIKPAIDKLEKEKKLNGEIWKGMTTTLASYLTEKESWKGLEYLMSKEDLKLDEWYDHNQKWKLIAKMIDQEASFEKIIKPAIDKLEKEKKLNGEIWKGMTTTLASYLTEKESWKALEYLLSKEDLKLDEWYDYKKKSKLIAKMIDQEASFEKIIKPAIDKLEKEKKLNSEIWKGMTTTLASYLTEKKSWKALGYLMSKKDLKLDEWYDYKKKSKLIAKMIDQEASFDKIIKPAMDKLYKEQKENFFTNKVYYNETLEKYLKGWTINHPEKSKIKTYLKKLKK